jgi:hypothetical protein
LEPLRSSKGAGYQFSVVANGWGLELDASTESMM